MSPKTYRSRAAFLVPTMTLALAACGASGDPCASSTACPDGTVCHPGGHCAPLSRQARFAEAQWLPVAAWGVTRADRPSATVAATDVLLLGGDLGAVAYLGFGPLPVEAGVVRAQLVLQPHESWSGAPVDARVLVHRTRPFRGGGLTRRAAPESLGGSVDERPIEAGGPRPIVLDVTDALRQARQAGRAHLYLELRVDEAQGLPWRLASPRAADPDLRPRLELGLR